MAVTETDPCSIASLTADSVCLQCYSLPEKNIIKIWAMAQLLNQLGGDDVTALGDLLEAVKCYTCESPLTLDGFEAAIWLNSAAESGVPELTAAQFAEAIKCWKCLDPITVKAAYTLLLCKISQAQVAPVL